MLDFGPGRHGWVRGGWVATLVALALWAAVVVAGEPPAPWEIQGYRQTPVWGGAESAPDASGSPDGPPSWTDSGPWQPAPRHWSERDGAPEYPRADERGPRGRRNIPVDGDRGFSSPYPTDAYSPGRSDAPGYPEDPGYGFRTDRAASDPWSGPRHVPEAGAGDFSVGGYPGYRFRGDPEPVRSPWSSQPGGGGYRFRPLTEPERNRRERGSVWRPAEPGTAPWLEEPGGGGSDRDTARGPAYGFEPNPWQVR
jgi:hypothetical protein